MGIKLNKHQRLLDVSDDLLYLSQRVNEKVAEDNMDFKYELKKLKRILSNIEDETITTYSRPCVL
ncbi:hypothetical protein CD117_08455 [Mammaliicoccus sciuri]|uniref:Uncharacterized protein n=1 Tax=Mammaliicoccus sciuri TaxID=1296 RepID=A0AAJ4SHK7_MAMSC|nr:hypothetical protein [Mammaliicoccus sciuri]RTX72583.1 hypothetical protein CD117_08455 [Mammaliicoccus sciuri]